MSSFLEAFSFPFMRNALWGALLIGSVSALVGVYVVLRRMAFLGISLAQFSSLGVALALFFNLNPSLLSILLVFLAILLLTLFTRGKEKIPREGLTGATYAFALAFSLLLLSKSAKGEAGVLESLFGNLLALHSSDIITLLIAFIPVALVYLLFNKELTFISFDEETARAMGLKTSIWNLLFYLTVGLVLALSTRLAGVFFSFSMLVVPPFSALLVARRFNALFPLSLTVAVLSSLLGLYLSYTWDLPPSGTIVALCFAFLLILLLVNRIRGK